MKNMTVDQAIKILKKSNEVIKRFFREYRKASLEIPFGYSPKTAIEEYQAVSVAVKALEAQIPLPVRREITYRCPVCNKEFNGVAGITNYCGNCGQRITF